jgi:hypothetical protein
MLDEKELFISLSPPRAEDAFELGILVDARLENCWSDETARNSK